MLLYHKRLFKLSELFFSPTNLHAILFKISSMLVCNRVLNRHEKIFKIYGNKNSQNTRESYDEPVIIFYDNSSGMDEKIINIFLIFPHRM